MITNHTWKTISTEQIADCKVFSVNRNFCVSTEGREQAHNFYVLHPHNWVNVIPVTEDGQVVLVEQFRHGTGEFTLEIPGGMIDPEDLSPAHAAERELFEETGFVADTLVHIGRNHPNPAIQSNFCDTFFAPEAKQIAQPKFEGTEYIELKLVPLQEIPALIQARSITSALVIVAFHYLDLHKKSLL
ncbi:MAG: NUDIX hydrolase [Candidatus Obscuribacterales bacterium]|nr:NUDIX hydrolase [Candidatus Obscuribacterales bacterium]